MHHVTTPKYIYETYRNIHSHMRQDSDLLVQTRIIGRVQELDKLRLEGNGLQVDTASSLQFMRRFIYGDTRDRCFSRMRVIVTELMLRVRDVSKEIQTSESSEGCSSSELHVDEQKNFIKDALHTLCESVAGIRNLGVTYEDDPKMNSKLDQLRVEVCSFVNAMKVMTQWANDDEDDPQ